MGMNETQAAAMVLAPIHQRLREAAARDAHPGWDARDARLAALERLVRENAPAIAEAIRGDFGNRSLHETQLLELFPSLEAIRHARRHLKSWMRPERRAVSMWFLPGRARVLHQPLGVVGIIVPWNYPLLLAVGPLVAALAAGNRVMVKMSEYTPAMSDLFARLVGKYFADDEVAVVQGDAGVAQAFALLPFGHLLFTGSTKVGYSVMRAAAENLTPVTLELGGKSPAILGPDYPLEKFAERVMVAKTMNAGQTCIAPDYVLVPAGQAREFIAAARKVVDACYPDILRTPDYSSIISERHLDLAPAYTGGAKLAAGSTIPRERTRAPISFDQLVASLGTLTQILGPSDAPGSTDVGSLLNRTALAWQGRGTEFNQALTEMSAASGVFGARADDIGGLITSLDQLMSTFRAKQVSLDGLVRSMGDLSAQWQGADQGDDEDDQKNQAERHGG